MQAVLAVLLLAGRLLTAVAPPGGWQVAASLPGVFDVAGPLPDGRLVVAADKALWLLQPQSGATERYAPGFGASGGYEGYLAAVPAQPPAACFEPGDLFALTQTPTGAVSRVDAHQVVTRFAVVPAVDGLSGIAFDTVGSFGGGLLVFGAHRGKTTVAAIDCKGSVTVVTTQAPVAEGGAAVAPRGFGSFGGDLVLLDELSGRVFALAPDGATAPIAAPPLAHGGDIGVEGAGFVPTGDVRQDEALFADRSTPGSPHPGGDYLLAAHGSLLAAAGVRAGDLLVATEGGAALDAIRCAATCTWIAVIAANATSHGEGHVLVLSNAAATHAPAASFGHAPAQPLPIPQILLLALAAAALPLLGLRLRAARGSRSGPS